MSRWRELDEVGPLTCPDLVLRVNDLRWELLRSGQYETASSQLRLLLQTDRLLLALLLSFRRKESLDQLQE